MRCPPPSLPRVCIYEMNRLTLFLVSITFLLQKTRFLRFLTFLLTLGVSTVETNRDRDRERP
jgi:hypothetical protein